jgi:iron complex transport system substrate-binding protein
MTNSTTEAQTVSRRRLLGAGGGSLALAATPSLPVRVTADVNLAGAPWDFGVRPVGIFGWNITGPDSVGPAGGSLDTSTVTFLNAAGTTIDVEEALSVDPDLVVSLYYGEKYGVWSILPEDVARVEQIAAQRAAYEISIQRLTGVLSAKPGMSALFIAPDTASIYVANPDAAGDVMLFRDLGLDVPKLPVAPGEYWQQLSLQEAGTYQTDLLFYSMRGVLTSKEEVMAHPTVGLLPAAKAGQVFPWNQDVILNYPGVAASLDAMSSAVETSDPNTTI